MYKWIVEITGGYDAVKVIIADDFFVNDNFIEFFNGDIQSGRKTVILINKDYVISIKSENV